MEKKCKISSLLQYKRSELVLFALKQIKVSVHLPDCGHTSVGLGRQHQEHNQHQEDQEAIEADIIDRKTVVFFVVCHPAISILSFFPYEALSFLAPFIATLISFCIYFQSLPPIMHRRYVFPGGMTPSSLSTKAYAIWRR